MLFPSIFLHPLELFQILHRMKTLFLFKLFYFVVGIKNPKIDIQTHTFPSLLRITKLPVFNKFVILVESLI